MTRIYFFALIISLTTCGKPENKKLPMLGRHEFLDSDSGIDTVFHTVKDFSFIDQDSSLITNSDFDGKIYVSDFFFTSCPSICPLMKVQMLRVYEKYNDNSEVSILSHTIDPDYDNVKVLKDYAERLEVKSNKWHFVTGVKDSIYNIAQTSYYIGVRDDGSFEHSGKFVLVDKQRRIRGVYDGTDEEAVDKLLKDMDILLQE
ncbi:MAG: SCO family protein [Cyclobacteriaceae bacterium]|nr:SCO family protein [Cyclobacteriaceae bacterium]